MQYVRRYTGPDGESHFEDVEVPLEPQKTATGVSQRLERFHPAEGAVMFTQHPRVDLSDPSIGEWGPWHLTTEPKFIIWLEGEVELQVSDGEIRRFGPGDVLFTEDMTGNGHRNRRLTATMRNMFVSIAPVAQPSDHDAAPHAFSPTQILGMFEAHAEPERQMDLEGTMATVAAEPRYELHPVGLEMKGRLAVEEFYRRTLPTLTDRRRSVHLGHYFGARSLVVEFRAFLGSDPLDYAGHPSLVVADFDDDGGVLSERLYYDDDVANMLNDALGPDFVDVDGVSRMY